MSAVEWHDAAVPPLYQVASWVFNALVGWRKRWRGLEHVPAGGFVLAANHVSNVDPFVVSMPLYPRRVHWMAKAELYSRWLTPALDAMGAFPVRRGEADTEAMRRARELLQAGEIIGMFPEGTRARKGLRKQHVPKPHPGTARIALAAGVPILPAAIAGTDRLLRFGLVTIAYGPPVPVDDLAGLPRRRAAEIATERLMEAIASLVASIGEDGGPGTAPEHSGAKG
jgi:1-acyl-sn-glycerol-3-phosphate acyltransferase